MIKVNSFCRKAVAIAAVLFMASSSLSFIAVPVYGRTDSLIPNADIDKLLNGLKDPVSALVAKSQLIVNSAAPVVGKQPGYELDPMSSAKVANTYETNGEQQELLNDPEIQAIIDAHFGESGSDNDQLSDILPFPEGEPTKYGLPCIEDRLDSKSASFDRYIIKFKDSQKAKKARENFSAGFLSDIRTMQNTSDDKIKVVRLKEQLTENDMQSKFSKEKNFRDIEYIQPDYILTISSVAEGEANSPTVESETDNSGDTDIDSEESDETEADSQEDDASETEPPIEGEEEIPEAVVAEEVIEPESFFDVNDTFFYRQWALYPSNVSRYYLKDINVGDAWNKTIGSNVIVAVLDTGVDIDHEDLAANIWTNELEIAGNGIDDDGNGYIDDINGWNFFDDTNTVHDPERAYDEWHGTHIAGIIGAEGGNETGIVGVAPGATIMPLQVFKNGAAYTSDIIDAIEYAEQNGALIVNCSWGCSQYNQALDEAMAVSGMLFIASAGNRYADLGQDPVYPAAFTADNIISVGSIGKTGNLSRFSNYSVDYVKVTAPGDSIFSLTPNNDYQVISGTSQSAAFVAGQAALIASLYPDLSASEIRERILSSSDHLTCLENKVNDARKINLAASLADPLEETTDIIEVEEEVYDTSEPLPDEDGYSLYSIDEWNARKNMTTARAYLGIVEVDGKIYAIGGRTASGSTAMTAAVEMYDPVANTWTSRASMPSSRCGHAAAVIDSKIYVVGGYYNGSYLNTLLVYDTVANTWSTKANMPTARGDLCAAAVDGKLYAIGGDIGGTTYYNTVQMYDPSTNTWTTKASMAAARKGLSASVVNGKIYAIAGFAGSALNNVEVYDPKTDTWTTKASMPASRYYLSTESVNGRIYAIAGFNGGDKSDVYVYDSVSDTWGTCASIPTARSGLGAAGIDGKIYAVGGYAGTSYCSITEVYGLPAGNWKTIANAPTAKKSAATAILNGKLYIFGGYDGTSYSAAVNSYDLNSKTWASLQAMPAARAGMEAIVLSGKIYIIGGTNGVSYHSRVDVYDPQSNTWTQKAGMQTGRGYLSAVALYGKIYAIGGYNGVFINNVEEYDPVIDSWSVKANMPTARAYHDASTYNGIIYACGGSNGSGELNTVEAYDLSENTWSSRSWMSTARSDLGVETVNGMIYAVGGKASNINLDIVEEYDPINDVWLTKNKENMIRGKSAFGTAVLNGKLYTVSGLDSQGYSMTIEEYSPITNLWKQKAPLPAERYDHASVAYNGKIYTMGGENRSGEQSTLIVYDPLTDTWTPKTNMTETRTGFAAVEVNGKIYAMGGNDPKKSVEMYDPDTNTWMMKANMLTGRQWFSAASVNGKIYVFGGHTGTISNTVEEYNTATNTWTSKAAMPTARMFTAAAAANGKIYVIGGESDNGRGLSTVEEYNPATNTWSTKAPMPTGRSYLGAVTVNDDIYAIGGYCNIVEKYDVLTNTWESCPMMPMEKEGFGAATVNGKIYVIGGYGDGVHHTVEEFDTGTGMSVWQTAPGMTLQRYDFGVAEFNNKIYVAGGNSGSSSMATLEIYDNLTKSWVTKASMNTARAGFGMAVINNKIYAVGGYSGSTYLKSVEEYDPATDTWTLKASMSTARGKLSVVALNGLVYAVGGYSGTSYLKTVEAYNPAADTWAAKASLAASRANASAGVCFNLLYVFGGYNGTSYLSSAEKYNPSTNTWASSTAMPVARSSASCSVFNNKLYLFGGSNGTNMYLDYTSVFDPSMNRWGLGTELPTMRGDSGACTVGDSIYVIGGRRYTSNELVLSAVEKYNPMLDNYYYAPVASNARQGAEAVQANGFIYIMGGTNDSGYCDTIEVYAARPNSRPEVRTMPTSRSDFGMTAIDEKIFLAGGFNGSFMNSLEEYDTATRTWTTKTNMPTARKGLTLTAISGKLYAIGGENQSGYLNTVEEYDPYLNAWKSASNMPTARSYAGAAAINGIIYVVGGRNQASLNTLETFNPVTGQWASIDRPMPTARYAFGIAQLGREIAVFGGTDGSDYLSYTEIYDAEKALWESKPPTIFERAYFPAVGIGEVAYLFNGVNNNGYLSEIETYYPGSLVWTRKADLPVYLSYHSVASINGIIYCVGGRNNATNKYSSALYAYDPATGVWSQKASMKKARRDASIAVANGILYVMGGYDGNALNMVEAYNPSSNTWTTKANTLTVRRFASTASINGKIYLFGGEGGSAGMSTVEEYNPATNTWSKKANMPTGRNASGIAVLNNKAYVISGSSSGLGGANVGAVEIYDPSTNSWEIRSDIAVSGALGADAFILYGKIYALLKQQDILLEYDEAADNWITKGVTPLWTSFVQFTSSSNNRIYGVGFDDSTVLEGNIVNYNQDPISELIHFGEEDVNLSGNFSRTYNDLQVNAPGFEVNLSRTYNSRDFRTDSPISGGWTFGFQGSVKDHDAARKIVRLPNGGAQTFMKNADGTFTAADSRSRLVKQADNTYILTTKDQYTYGFDTNGWMNWMKDRNGNTITITVDSAGKVSKIKDQNNREISVTYTSGRISTITDFAGRTVTYQYTSNRLSKVIDPLGKATNYTYDANGLLSTIKDHDNNLIESVVYEVAPESGALRIKSLTDRFGNVRTHTYDVDYRIMTVSDSNNRKIVTWFDSSLYPIAVQDPDGRRIITQYSLDAYGNNKYGEETTTVDRNGNKTIFERDSNGNVTKVYHQDSSSSEYGYDDKDNRIWQKDEDGKYTFYVYDANGINLIKEARPLNGTDQYGTTPDSGFAVTTYTYYTDAEAQSLGYKPKALLKSVTNPEGGVTSYTYDANGNIKTITNPLNKVTTNTVDVLGRVTNVLSPGGYNTSYVYDNNGNLEKIIRHEGEVTRITYNNMNRKIKEVAPNLYNPSLDNIGSHTYSGDHGHRYTYLANGTVGTYKDPNGYQTTYTYDLYGNVLTETKANGSIYIYTYDVLGRKLNTSFKANSSAPAVLLEGNAYSILADGKTTITKTTYLSDTETAVIVYTYDYAGRLIRTDNPDGTYTASIYNPNGTLASQRDERGNSTYFSYDGLNRLAEQWTPFKAEGGTRYTYTAKEYDKAGNITGEKTGKELVSLYGTPSSYVTVSNTYYSDGRLKTAVRSSGGKTEYQYNAEGNLSRADEYIDQTNKRSTEYVHNHLGLLTFEKLHVRAGDVYGNTFTDNTDTLVQRAAYTYDKNGNVLTVTDARNVVTTYTYDNLDRVLSSSQPGVNETGSSVTISTSKTYNYAGKVLTETDPNGRVTAYSYDEQGNPVKVTNAKGYVTAFYYDRAGRLTAEVAPQDYNAAYTLAQMNRTEYAYDQMSRVRTKTHTYYNTAGCQWVSFVAKAFKYDGAGNVIKELDALGYEAGTGSTPTSKINTGYGTTYVYDLAGNVIETLDPVAAAKGSAYSSRMTYDTSGREISRTDGKGIVTTYNRDDDGNILTVSTGGQTIQSNTYDFLGNTLTKADGNGNITTFTYNAFGKVRTQASPSDATIAALTNQYQYDADGNLKWNANSMGMVQLASYDNQGRLIALTEKKSDDTQVISTTTKYDKAGNERFTTDPNGNITTNVYDELNRLTSTSITVSGVVQTTGYTYDKNGNLLTKTNWRGNVESYAYDPLNRLTGRTDQNGVLIEKLEYNNSGAQIKSWDALNRLTQYAYDRNSRLISTTDPVGHITSQTYDAAGNIETATDGKGNVTTYAYDNFNRLASVTDAKNQTTSYTYDLAGNMLTQTDPRGLVMIYEYNVANKLTKRIDHGGRSGVPGSYSYVQAKLESYLYNPDGSLALKTDRNNVVTAYVYDIHGRTLSETAGTSTVSYTYDNNSNQLTMTDSTGTTTRTYDALGRVLTKAVPNIGTTTFVYNITSGVSTGFIAETTTDPKNNVTRKVYDKTMRMVSVTAGGQTTSYTYYNDGSKWKTIYPGGASEEYTYTQDNLLSALINKKADQTVIDSYSYTYDAAHNMLTKTDGKGTTSYQYDELNRLTRVTEPNGRITVYTYDASGNRATQTVTLSGNVTLTSYTYDNQNRLTETATSLNGTPARTDTYTYDNNGNQTRLTSVEGGITSITDNTYDTFNQMIQIVLPGGSTLSYAYNGEGKRILKTAAGGQTTRYLFEGNAVILELDGSGNTFAVNVRGTSLIARTTGGQTAYYMYNGHGDATALLSAAGTILGTYYYDAFGVLTESFGTFNNPYTYAGYQYDQETGLYYLQSRMYDPVIARFLQEDTYRGRIDDPLSLNYYAYCTNNPLIYTDPDGYWKIGDEKYSITVQKILKQLTDAYHSAATKAQRDDIAAQADSVREKEDSKSSKGSNSKSKPTGIADSFAKAINSIIDKKGYLTASEWQTLSTSYERRSSGVAAIKSTTIISSVINTIKNNSQYSDYRIGSKGYLEEVDIIRKTQSGKKAIEYIINDEKAHSKELDTIKNDYFLKGDPKFKNFYTVVNGLVTNFETVTESIHYFRNRLNWAPSTLKELADFNKNLSDNNKWLMMPADMSLYHMQGDGGYYNVKFVSGDGFFEAVYNKNGYLVTNAINMGTYNYAPVTTKGSAAHGSYDVVPYYAFGNTSDSPQKGLNIQKGLEAATDQYNANQLRANNHRHNILEAYHFNVYK